MELPLGTPSTLNLISHWYNLDILSQMPLHSPVSVPREGAPGLDCEALRYNSVGPPDALRLGGGGGERHVA